MSDLVVFEEVLFVHLLLRLPFLLILSVIALIIQMIRSRIYGYLFYRPFLLNIVLAWIPFLLSIFAYIFFLNADFTVSIFTIAVLIVWFVFFPNSIYLITEVHHFRDETTVPLWFDTIAILLIVSTGIFLGIHSLAIIHFLLNAYVSPVVSWLLLISYIYLATFGIFIGRYLRFNSWDVLQKPWLLFSQVIQALDTPQERRDMLLFTILFTLFIVGLYIFDVYISLWTEYAFELRLTELRGPSTIIEP